MVARKTLREVFERRVEKIPGGCWIWHGDTINTGYGRLRYRHREQLAHRISWELAHGQPVPKGMWVFHACDNPLCVNPAHLYIARPHNTQLTRVKLTEEQVCAVRSEWAAGTGSMSEIAQRFGVSKSTVQHIIQGTRWNYLSESGPEEGQGEQHG